jgi:hypothetical protein
MSDDSVVGFDQLGDSGFDGWDLTLNLFETLSVLALQQRQVQRICAILGGGATFTKASRARRSGAPGVD